MEAKIVVLVAACVGVGFILPAAIAQSSVIEIIPNVTHPGDPIKIRGYNLTLKHPYNLHIDGDFFYSGVTLLNGTLNRDLTLPRTLSLGVHVLNFTSADMFASVEFLTIQWPAEITVIPGTTYPGAVITITGSGYPPNAAYWIYIDGEKTLSGATDSVGGFNWNYQLPKTFPLGLHNISANATQYFGPPSSRAPLQIIDWPVSVMVDPVAPHPGSRITIRGGNLPPLSLYEVLLDGVVILNGGTDLQGTFVNQYTLSPTISLGEHLLVARATEYAGDPSGSFTLQLVQWPVQLSVDPLAARSGEGVALQGVGYPPSSAIWIYLGGQKVKYGNSNGLGEFNISYLLPKSLEVGMHEFVATAPSYSGPPSAATNILIKPWEVKLTVDPAEVHPGTTISIDGSSYPPYATCQIYLDSGLIIVLVADSQGNFQTTWELATDLFLGQHDVSAEVVNYAGPPTTSDSFMATQWPLAIFIDSKNVTKGALIELNGSGFPPQTSVRVYWEGTNYLKAGTTSVDGRLYLPMVINFQEDDSYHSLVVNVSDTFTGPPSVTTYLWLGSSPPEMSVYTYDDLCQPRSRFFDDEEIYIGGSGFPPGIDMIATVVSVPPVIGSSIPWITSALVRTDMEGNIPLTLLWNSHGPGNFSILVDVNANMILDNTDLVAEDLLSLRLRPDIAILDLGLTNESPVQGEAIVVSVLVTNQGDSVESFNMTLKLDSTSVDSVAILDLNPRASKAHNFMLGTGALALGAHNLTANAHPVSNETDVADNSITTMLDVLSRPDVEVVSVLPDKEIIRVGGILQALVVVRNSGERAESFNVNLLVDSATVAMEEVQRLLPGADHALTLQWDTSQEIPRNISLAVMVSELPYEAETTNNVMTYGMLTLLAPNIPPVPDPNGPYVGQKNVVIALDGSGSYDTDGLIVSYVWDFGDGQAGEGRIVTHTYEAEGSYHVTLNVTDDEGAWSIKGTTCNVVSVTYMLNVSVVDAVSGGLLTDSTIQVGWINMTLADGTGSFPMLEPGTYSLSAKRDGYFSKSIEIVLANDLVLDITLEPQLSIQTSDSTGMEKTIFSPNETVYVTIISPGSYSSRGYVIASNGLSNLMPLMDASGLGFASVQIGRGRTVVPLWARGLEDGDFMAVLDLDQNGVFNAVHDTASVSFTIPEIWWILLVLSCLAMRAARITFNRESPSVSPVFSFEVGDRCQKNPVVSGRPHNRALCKGA